MKLARILEFAATIPLIGFMYDNFYTSRNYYEAQLMQATVLEIPAPVKEFCTSRRTLQHSIEQLAEAYDDEYYNPYTTTESYMDFEGNFKTRTVTKYRWEEPSNIPDHSVIYESRDTGRDLASKCDRIMQKPIIDENKLREIEIINKTHSKGAQGAANLVLGGGCVALLLGYEEIYAHLEVPSYDYGYHKPKTLDDKMNEINSEEQITRRSLLKIPAALAGAFCAYKLKEHTKQECERGKEDLRKNISTLLRRVEDYTPEQAFQTYFGQGPALHIAHTKKIHNLAQKTAPKVKEHKVQSAFYKVTAASNSYLNQCTRLFSAGVPKELALASKFGLISNAIENLNNQYNAAAGASILLENMAIAGVMAAIIIPGELWNSKLAKSEKTIAATLKKQHQH
ncbi:hypothetical protein KY330_03475 [Candidatus Woesearchaeota archaeon]|nr:hypothetical protein [Candidatus Woesearchaeota archaeon]